MGKTRTDGAERNLGQDDLSEYLRAKEPGRAELAGIWRAAIGLQKVDGLTPSAYLVETARRNIEGEITIAEAGKIIGEYYKSKAVRAEAAKTRTDEADNLQTRRHDPRLQYNQKRMGPEGRHRPVCKLLPPCRDDGLRFLGREKVFIRGGFDG